MFSIQKLNSLSSSIAVTKGTEMNSKGTVVTLNDKVLTKYKQLSGSCSKTVKISMVANSLLIPETGRAKKMNHSSNMFSISKINLHHRGYMLAIRGIQFLSLPYMRFSMHLPFNREDLKTACMIQS